MKKLFSVLGCLLIFACTTTSYGSDSDNQHKTEFNVSIDQADLYQVNIEADYPIGTATPESTNRFTLLFSEANLAFRNVYKDHLIRFSDLERYTQVKHLYNRIDKNINAPPKLFRRKV